MGRALSGRQFCKVLATGRTGVPKLKNSAEAQLAYEDQSLVYSEQGDMRLLRACRNVTALNAICDDDASTVQYTKLNIGHPPSSPFMGFPHNQVKRSVPCWKPPFATSKDPGITKTVHQMPTRGIKKPK